MSDKQAIITSLQKVERRVRTNRLVRDLAYGFALSLLLPLSFKILDLISPFRARTVAAVHGLWLVGFLAYLVWRLMQKGTLAQAAASLDSKAVLHDELKTAYWFINNPRPSEWVEFQIRKAAATARRLEVGRLYPRVIPKVALLAAAMLVLTAGLNFVPLPWNHNWLVLQAAPAYELSDQERTLLEQTMELLKKAQQLEQTDIVDRLQEIVEQLQDGDITPAAALQQLQEIANLLGSNPVDLAAMYAGLNEMAKDFQQSEQLQEAAEALKNRDLSAAAKELGEAGEKLADLPLDAQKELEKSLQEASENSTRGLENLAKDLEQAASDLKQANEQAAGEALKNAAQDLQQLSQQIQRQKLRDQARQALEGLGQAMLQRQQGEQRQAEQGESGDGEGEPGKQQMPGGEKGQAAPSGQGPSPAPGQAGSAEGGGLEPSASLGVSSQEEGPATKLDVQLERETLTGQHDQGTKPEDLEEASKQERSKLDYRNVESELTPAQKDLLNQDRIPWEYRTLIKNYFQAIKPPKDSP